MEQYNIWRRYFIIGILINILMIYGCNIIREPSQTGEYYFINNTNYNISYSDKSFEQYNVAANQTLKITKYLSAGKYVNETTFPGLIGHPDHLTEVRFDQTRCLKAGYFDAFGPANLKNYVAKKINKNTYRFTYTFTEADYNRAVTCP